MEEARWERLRGGVVGQFQALGSRAAALPGMAKLGEESAEITVVGSSDWLDENHFAPECAAVLGWTEVGHLLLCEITSRFGAGGGPAAGGYRGKCVVLDPDLEAVEADLVSLAQVSYFGVSAWAGDRHLLADEEVREGGRMIGFRTEVRSADPLRAELGDGYSVHLLSNWGLDHEFDRRVISMPFIVRVSASSRRSVHEHLSCLDAVGGLLALCHREAPAAETGAVRLTRNGRFSKMWDRDLMSGPAPSRLDADFPLVRLVDLGGIEGVAKWVGLTREHPRIVDAVVRQAKGLSGTPESRLLSTAVAIESWVKFNKRTGARWAQQRIDGAWPGALSKVVDDAWRDWIGDSRVWVERFWAEYTAVKHGDQSSDPMRLHVLETAGRYLLAGALLDHCASSTEPSARLFGESLWQVGEAVRKEVERPAPRAP